MTEVPHNPHEAPNVEPLIDSHAHLDFPELKPEAAEAVERARQAGLCAIINAGSHPAGNRAIVQLAERLSARGVGPAVFPVAGCHPHHADEAAEEHWEEMRDLAASGKVVGLGEFGLDFHYDNSPREAQREAFRRGIALAAETRLPLIIHSREAPEETLTILDAACPGGNYPAGVFHCFTGTPDFAQEVMKRGFFIGFTGIVTFPNADDVRETAREVPLERMLVETDAPFCSPVPMRGKTNEPAYVVHVARKIAELHGATEGDVRRITTQNAVGLFRLPLADALGAKLEKGAKRGH